MYEIETTEECVKVQKLRDLIKDINQDDLNDVFLLRFIRARDTPEKAEGQLRKALKWRDEIKIEQYLTCQLNKKVKEDLYFKYSGRDHEGRPVYWIPMGRWHVRQLLEEGYKADILNMKYHLLEYVTSNTRKLGHQQSVIIFGIENLVYSQVLHYESMQLLFQAFRDLEQYYPETIKTMYIINTPWYFPSIMNVFRPLLSPRTSAKLKIFNGDKNTWLPVLKEAMPEETIPAEYLESKED